MADAAGLILVVNAGSSSCKLRLLGPGDAVVETADLPAIEGSDAALVAEAIDGWAAPAAVGHRVVHGGTRFAAPVVLDPATIAAIDALSPLAPLHQPRSLAGISAVRAALPDVPHVAAFDTAFHATLPDAASTYAIPAAWRELGVRRYGFHGLSHAYASRRAARRCAGASVTTRSASSPATSAPAPRWRRCAAAARSTRRWASRRSRGS